jgi:aromatic-L-amino-acid/L-tryptophan decarboxylase
VNIYTYLQTIGLNDHFANLIRSSSIFTLVTRPSFALSVFRILPAGSSYSFEELNTLNRSFHGRLLKRSDIILTQTVLNGVFCMRFAVGARETLEEDIENAFKVISQEAEDTLKEQQT